MERTLTHGIGVCLAVLALASTVPTAFGIARAQANESDQAVEPAGYREVVTEALQEFEAQNFEESRSLFHRAHTLFPNARTYRGLGFTEFELRHYPAAIGYLEAALSSRVRPLNAGLRADTERMLERAKAFVGRLRLEVKPSGASVSVDSQPVTLTAGTPLLLQVGDHTLEVHAPGFVASKRELSVQGGEDTNLTILLTPAHEDVAVASSEPRRWYKSPWLWASVGVVVAGAAAGAGYALTRDEPSPRYGGTANTRLTGP